MSQKLLPIPAWFWELIDGTKPELSNLEKRLEALDEEKLEDYYGFYRSASHVLCEPWNGPFIDDEIGHLSEDSTEDLCDWIVSQGYEAWSPIAAKSGEEKEAALREMFWLEHKIRSGEQHPSLVKWNYRIVNPEYRGCQSPGALPSAIFREKFGFDIYEIEEEIFTRIDAVLSGK